VTVRLVRHCAAQARSRNPQLCIRRSFAACFGSDAFWQFSGTYVRSDSDPMLFGSVADLSFAVRFGSVCRQVTVPVPAPYLDHKKKLKKFVS
jgi:hypothetical protein